MNYRYFTSESVSCGHPDKICDQISDSILDECLSQDRNSHTAVECLATANRLIIAGEVKSCAKVDYVSIARRIIRKSGYTNDIYNFSFHSPVENFIHQQSADIDIGVTKGGAGDQGMMFGYATSETEELMPLPIMLSHKLISRLDNIKKKKEYSFLRPDGKSQVRVVYEKGKPEAVDKVVLAVPHNREIANGELKSVLWKNVVTPVFSGYGFQCDEKDLVVNGTGRWEIGGPASDTGLTGRKIMVDTYGGMGRHGGGCFSGKDPSKVDRIGAYAARFIAKNIVARKMASRCEVQVAYVIGKKTPFAKAVETFGTEMEDKRKIEKYAWNLLDLSVSGIISAFDLLRPIYLPAACYGHFGRSIFPWEKIVN
ncbi:methionine adenosyltransferase [Patescibacteria group bacterium]|nr:methionine adenosyltransferase [Patescibacteria group bacterium]MCL5798236.1 methionine adenosyltransferase [Patescibacteria group bacterium]